MRFHKLLVLSACFAAWTIGETRQLVAQDQVVTKDHRNSIHTFTNSKDGLVGNRLNYYLDFSLKYSDQWKLTPRNDDANNFISLQLIEQPDSGETNRYSEQLFIGSLNSWGSKNMQFDLLKQLSSEFQQQFSSSMKDFVCTSEDRVEFLAHDAYQFHASFVNEHDEQCWLRVVFVPSLQEDSGALFLMVANENCDGVSGANDIGVRGQLPKILASIKFGKD